MHLEPWRRQRREIHVRAVLKREALGAHVRGVETDALCDLLHPRRPTAYIGLVVVDTATAHLLKLFVGEDGCQVDGLRRSGRLRSGRPPRAANADELAAVRVFRAAKTGTAAHAGTGICHPSYPDWK